MPPPSDPHLDGGAACSDGSPETRTDLGSEPGSEAGSEVAMGAGADTSGEPSIAEIEAHPMREMLSIAAPTVVTMTSYTVMQFIDALMVKEIGEDPVYVAAQGNGGVAAWLLMAMILGLTTVVNSYVSQNLGAGKPRAGAAYAWNAIWLSVGGWAMLMLPAALIVPSLFTALGHDDTLRSMETDYAQIILVGGVFTICGRAVGHYFYGMHRPTVVMVSVLTGNAVNVLANWVLIFGHWGFEPLGVAGAAYGTVIGSLVEFAIPMVIFLGPRYAREFGTRTAWKPSKRHIADIFRIGWPGALMFANEMACWTILMVALIPMAAKAGGQDPVIANTAGWIGLRYMHVSFMPTVGLSIALQAIVGKCMGMKRPDLAASRTWLGVRVGLIYMGLCAVSFVIFRDEMVAVFIDGGTGPEERAALVRMGSQVMIAAAVFQLFDALAILLSGALRGAGDTVWPGMATLILSWTFIVGGGFAMIKAAPQLGSVGPWVGATAFLVTLGLAMLLRFTSGKWRTLSLVRKAVPAATPADGPASGAGSEPTPDTGSTHA